MQHGVSVVAVVLGNVFAIPAGVPVGIRLAAVAINAARPFVFTLNAISWNA